jgi:uncharacterized protein DUF4403
MPRKTLALALALSSTLGVGCAGFSAVYPPRPSDTPGEAIADPTPAKVVMHLTVTSAGLKSALEDNLPQTGEGTFPLLGKDRQFTWKRTPAVLRFTQGRIGLELHVDAVADLPVSTLEIGLDFKILAEPVVTSEYVAKLQSLEVTVTSNDRMLKMADTVAGVLEKMKKEVQGKLEAFSYDLRPMIAPAFERVARPIDLPLGEAHGCAMLKVLGVEAGPTVLADGFEKDLALVIAPSITIPCAESEVSTLLPPLANVASLPSGPFTVSLPVAARYDELAKAMTLAFTDGKLFFSKDFPKLYMEKPEVYAAKDQLVLKLHIAGPIDKFGFDTTLDGDIFMTGHPTVEDNELRVPDLEPTIETASLLLKLKAALDGNTIRDQARAALHLDIGERLRAVKEKLSSDLSFGNGQGCLKAQANKIEVSGVHVHAAYLRLYVGITGSAAVYMPCQ